MWILYCSIKTNGTSLGHGLSPLATVTTSVDLFTTYTDILHTKLESKTRLQELVQLLFASRYVQRRYKYIVYLFWIPQVLLSEKPFWFKENVLWNWEFQNAGLLLLCLMTLVLTDMLMCTQCSLLHPIYSYCRVRPLGHIPWGKTDENSSICLIASAM